MVALGAKPNGKINGHDDGAATELRVLVLPAILLGAAAIVFYSPERSLAVLLGLAAFMVSPMAAQVCEPQVQWLSSSMKQEAAKQTGELWGNAVLAFSRNRELWEEVMSALSEALERMSTDEKTLRGLKTAVVNLAADDAFQKQLAPVLGRVAEAASTSPQIHKAMFNIGKGVATTALADETLVPEVVAAAIEGAERAVKSGQVKETLIMVKQAVTDVFANQAFMDDMLSTIAPGVVATLENKALREAIVGVLKEGVGDALDDARFISRIRDTFCETLSAPHIYRSAVAGVAMSLNPFVRRGKWDALRSLTAGTSASPSSRSP